MLKAIVLIDSMKDGVVPENISDLITKEYGHDLGRDELAQIKWLEFSRERLPEVIFELSLNLRYPGYYSHITSKNEMFVVYPCAHISIARGNDSDVNRAHAIGDSFGVSRRNMSFRLMFDVDHPEMHGQDDMWFE